MDNFRRLEFCSILCNLAMVVALITVLGVLGTMRFENYGVILSNAVYVSLFVTLSVALAVFLLVNFHLIPVLSPPQPRRVQLIPREATNSIPGYRVQ